MKSKYLFIIMLGLFAGIKAYSDVIPDNSHYVDKCVTVTNLSEYPEIALIGAVSEMSEVWDYLYQVSDNVCLHKGYKFNGFMVFATSTHHLAEINLENFNSREDVQMVPVDCIIEPTGGYVDDNNPMNAIKQYYKIIGFTETNVILHMWKQVTGYNDGTADLVETFEYPGDTTNLSKSLILGIPNNQGNLAFSISPNPVEEGLTVEVNLRITGKVNVEFFSLNGELIKTAPFEVTGVSSSKEIATTDLEKGVYLVKVSQGAISVTQKILIP